MSIIDSFDETEEIVKAINFVNGEKKLPKIAIATFKQELIDLIEKDDRFEKYSETMAGSIINIYLTSYKGKDIIIYRTLIGGPSTVTIIEELHARGVQNFIFFGSCGTLDNKISEGKFIVPVEAYRDEGTSYHYLPATNDFIKVETAKKTAEIFDKSNIPYIKTKTWTTDAIYRETKKNMQLRKESGCMVVEMECASIMAVSKFRKINSYQFLYSDDTLDGDEWNLRTLKENRKNILEQCLDIALHIASEL